ncbi:phosphopyruvate hydratase [Candidatus Babela massiliensis]|uniref:Enolase n=1 Tax=Candidatus Babela massiliensis TaxID=673862 RepID=V6DGH4_9BACT|nr:phosphopyruvate hydratase [Candidatus Babela massiliensis]CDK30702.1 Enolase [Candidatus Babela massiliensis]
MKIMHILGREIFDSSGFPTVQCQVFLENGLTVTASVPSGKSIGSAEAYELRDGGSRLFGRGVTKAVDNIERIIAPYFVGKEVNAVDMDLKMIELDGTVNKTTLGANTLLAVSMALYRAEALIEKMELYEFIALILDSDSVRLPYPFFNLINGAKHADNGLTIQEFMIIPVGVPNFRGALEAGIVFFQELKLLLKKLNMPVEVSDEGGFAVGFENNIQAFDILLEISDITSKKYGLSCVFGIDVAASNYFDKNTGLYLFNNDFLNADGMIDYYQDLIKKYPIYSIEDGLDEQDWIGWAKMTRLLENQIQIVGDDLFATNIFRIAYGIEQKCATSVLIKPNQIGTITETLQAIKLSKDHGYNTIISHRASETEDSFIADLSVGSSCEQIKAGGCSRSERLAKYNRLLCIEDRLLFNFEF